MSKEQEIYRNMKKRGRIYKTHGKWKINYPSLLCSIEEAGYTQDESNMIIEKMLRKGYIRQVRDAYGRTDSSKGMSHHLSGYIIERWAK